MTLQIKAEANAGDHINRTAAEMQALSDRLNVGVEVTFNDVKLWAAPGGDPAKLIAGYEQAVGSKEHFKFASSRMIPKLVDVS